MFHVSDFIIKYSKKVSKYLRRHIKRTNSGVFIINICLTGALLLCLSLLSAAGRSMYALILFGFYLCCMMYFKEIWFDVGNAIAIFKVKILSVTK